MPPKAKGQQDQQIEISQLPPWQPINCVLKFETKKSRAEQIKDKLVSKPKSFQKNITKEEIINCAKEKGIYIDPNTLNDKQKKDTKFLSEVNLELTPAVLAKSIIALQADLDLQGRKDKKDKLDGVDQPDDKKEQKKDAKKEAKKDAKKGKKDEKVEEVEQQQKEEEKEAPEKDYKKALDVLYFLLDFPQQKEELIELNNSKAQIDLIILIKQKVSQVQEFEEQIENKDQAEEIEEGDENQQEQQQQEQQAQKKIDKEALTEEDHAYIQDNLNFVKNFKAIRSQSSKEGSLRKTVYKEIIYEVDTAVEEESLKTFIELVTEEICQFSIDCLQFSDWIQGKKTQPLIKPDKKVIEAQLLAKKKADEEAAALILAQQEAELLKKDPKLAKKGGKDSKKEEEKKIEINQLDSEKVIQDEHLQSQQQQQQEEKKVSIQEPFYVYNKQLNSVNLEQTGAGILLEVLLDQIEVEKDPQQQQINLKEKEENGQVESILNSLESFVQFSTQKSLQNFNQQKVFIGNENKNTESKIIIDETDEIERRANQQKLFNSESVAQRERKLFKNLLFPGIDRNQIPDVPTKSEQLRKAEKSQMYPFISCSVQEFERRQTIQKFEQLMKESDPERDWNFGDRIFLERHNKNTITQTIYKALLYEPQIFTRYNERDDNLFVALYYKNPQGRVLRQKWSAEWKVLPNLENWINFFKSNEKNLKNEFYYDLDYEQIGNLHEKTKILFPSDNSVILAQKYMVGDRYSNRFKVLKEGSIFGIKEDQQKVPQFFAEFENQTKLLVEYDFSNQHQQSQESQKLFDAKSTKCKFSLTVENGLMVQFLPNGDLVQQIVTPNNKRKVRDFTDMVNPYSSGVSASDQEIKRVISGKGSVIKYMKDGSTIIFYSNGNISQTKGQNSSWITTNNKGYRKLKNKIDGSEQQLDPIPCAKRTDPQQGSKIIIRGDETTIITYLDGSQYVQFKDGTKILTSSQKDQIIIEHSDYASVKIQIDLENLNTNQDKIITFLGNDTQKGFNNLFERSYDGRVVETKLPDGSLVLGYKELKENIEGGSQLNTIHLLFQDDGTVSKIQDDGEVTFISGQDRVFLNETGENREKDDIDYWLELFSPIKQRRQGVYTALLAANLLQTIDSQGNQFQLFSHGEIFSNITDVQLNPELVHFLQERPGTPDYQDGEYIDEEFKQLPLPQAFPPRLFIINNDNSAIEIFNEQQLKYYLNLKQNDKNCVKLIDNQLANYSQCDSYSFITKFIPINKRNITEINPILPKTLDILPQSTQKNSEVQSQTFLFRNLLKFAAFDQETREKHNKDQEKYDIWKKDQIRQQQDFGLLKKDEKERQQEFDIQLKIIESRRNNYSDESYDNVRKNNFQMFLSFNTQIEKLVLQVNPTISKADSLDIKNAMKEARRKSSYNGVAISFNQLNQLKLEQQNQKIDQVQTQQVQKVKEKKIYKPKKENTWDESIKIAKGKDHFVNHYFETIEGETAFKEMVGNKKIDLNPIVAPKLKALSGEAVLGKSPDDKQSVQIEGTQQELSPKENKLNSEAINSQNQFNNSNQQQKKQSTQKTIIIKPSVFTVRDVDDENKLQEEKFQAEKYVQSKNQNVNIYGQERKENQRKNVPCLLKTNPKSELNQKYILTDSLTDNRMKISSMHSRLYLKAPSIQEVRQTGTHTALALTIDKRNNLDDIEGKKNLMITSDLNDNLRRDLLINPVTVRFGVLRQGGIYEMKLTVKNEDIMAQRIVIKQTQTKYVKIFMKITGPIALGLTRDIIVRIDANAEIFGRFQDEFQIISKHEIYKIPVFANIMDVQDFDRIDQESKETNKKSVLKPYVIEINFGQEQNKQGQNLMDSANSDLLPKINNFDKNYKLDPYKSFGKKKKKNEEDDSFELSQEHK